MRGEVSSSLVKKIKKNRRITESAVTQTYGGFRRDALVKGGGGGGWPGASFCARKGVVQGRYSIRACGGQCEISKNGNKKGESLDRP